MGLFCSKYENSNFSEPVFIDSDRSKQIGTNKINSTLSKKSIKSTTKTKFSSKSKVTIQNLKKIN